MQTAKKEIIAMTVAQLYKQYIKPISITEQLELIALISNKLLVRADVKEKNGVCWSWKGWELRYGKALTRNSMSMT